MPAYERVFIGEIDKVFPEKRFAYDANDDLIYFGGNQDIAAATTDETWFIWKFTYTDTLLTRKQGPLVGSWDNRTSLGW